MRLTPLASLVLFLLPISLALNPVKIPILRSSLTVRTRPFAKLPDELGDPARIVSISSRPQSSNIYACTLTKIYEITPSGVVKLFLDVAANIKDNTGRALSVVNKKHGGVRSIAFHTNFRFNKKLYVAAMEERPQNTSRFNYISDVTDHIDADSVLIEYTYNSGSGKPRWDSYRNVFRVGMPVYDHPIKQIAFFGFYLYIAHGDGSVQSAIAGGGQGNNALGKILKISPLQNGSAPYTAPFSNPFVRNPRMKNAVWALGFRNPHNICFSNNGTLYIADAGRSNAEEINIGLAGKNYGWSEREGTFVHAGGGLVSGIRPLPADDAKFGYEYPVAQVGHDGPFRAGFIGQAIAGGCPIENESPMAGNYYYVDFPESGKLYFSRLGEMRKAVTRGPPALLKQARTRQVVNILFDHDNNPITPPKRFPNLGAVMRSEPGLADEDRVDVRMGRGPKGELYWSSKKSGKIYLFTSSLPGGSS